MRKKNKDVHSTVQKKLKQTKEGAIHTILSLETYLETIFAEWNRSPCLSSAITRKRLVLYETRLSVNYKINFQEKK